MTQEATALAEAQDAFVGLLTTPLITARTNPVLFPAILRHRSLINDWVIRLGYRLVVPGTVIRLHRDPSGPQLTAAPPPWETPPRRDLVLTALTAAACEGTDATITVQELSDEVRAISVSPGSEVTPYDPDRRSERQAFVRSLTRLAELGILIRRTSDETLLRQWEEEGTGIGAGFEIEREALLQFSDPYTVSLAFNTAAQADQDDDRTGTRGQRMLRILVEDTALLYADLHPVDAEYARGQRSWLVGQAADMTGGTVELREEGMLLRLPEDRQSTPAATIPVFPAATTTAWFALKTLDAAAANSKPDEAGQVRLADADVDHIVGRVYRDHFGALTMSLKESPGRLRSAVEQVLIGLGLIERRADDGWVIRPTAARYRDPNAVWEQTLEDAL